MDREISAVSANRLIEGKQSRLTEDRGHDGHARLLALTVGILDAQDLERRQAHGLVRSSHFECGKCAYW